MLRRDAGGYSSQHRLQQIGSSPGVGLQYFLDPSPPQEEKARRHLRLDYSVGTTYREAHEVLRRRFLHDPKLIDDPSLSLKDQWDVEGRSLYIDIFNNDHGPGDVLGSVRLTLGDSAATTFGTRGVIQQWTRGAASGRLPWGDNVLDVTRCVSVVEGKGLYGVLILLATWWAETHTSAKVMCGILRRELQERASTLMRIGFTRAGSSRDISSFDVPGQEVRVIPLLLLLAKARQQRDAAWRYTGRKLQSFGIRFPRFDEIMESRLAVST